MKSLLAKLLQLPARILFLALFLVSFALLGFGLVLQHVVGLHPCPMCVMQRMAFIVIGILALIAAIHGPQRTGQRVYATLIAIAALVGASIAARQTWLQLDPPPFPECGPGLGFMLGNFSLADALPMIFRGSGDCSAVEWSFLGLSIANWSLVWLSAIFVFMVWLMLRRTAR